MLSRLVNLFKRLRKKKVPVSTVRIELPPWPRSGEGKGRCPAELSGQGVNTVTPSEGAAGSERSTAHSRPENLRQGTPLLVRKSGQKATRQPIGKFMKHGHQAPWYRKTVKAKVRPEDEDN